MANVMNLAGVDAGTVAHVQSYNVRWIVFEYPEKFLKKLLAMFICEIISYTRI